MNQLMTEVIELLQQVRGPPGEAIPGPVGEDQISRFEDRTGLILPPGLRSWLLVSNGPCVGPGGLKGIDTARRQRFNRSAKLALL